MIGPWTAVAADLLAMMYPFYLYDVLVLATVMAAVSAKKWSRR
jgi:hypothetical protein